MVKSFMNDSTPDPREHFAETLDVEQTGRSVRARRPQENMIRLMLAQHVIDEVGGNRQLPAGFFLTREALLDQTRNDRAAAKRPFHQRRFGEPCFKIVTKHVFVE